MPSSQIWTSRASKSRRSAAASKQDGENQDKSVTSRGDGKHQEKSVTSSKDGKNTETSEPNKDDFLAAPLIPAVISTPVTKAKDSAKRSKSEPCSRSVRAKSYPDWADSIHLTLKRKSFIAASKGISAMFVAKTSTPHKKSRLDLKLSNKTSDTKPFAGLSPSATTKIPISSSTRNIPSSSATTNIPSFSATTNQAVVTSRTKKAIEKAKNFPPSTSTHSSTFISSDNKRQKKASVIPSNARARATAAKLQSRVSRKVKNQKLAVNMKPKRQTGIRSATARKKRSVTKGRALNATGKKCKAEKVKAELLSSLPGQTGPPNLPKRKPTTKMQEKKSSIQQGGIPLSLLEEKSSRAEEVKPASTLEDKSASSTEKKSILTHAKKSASALQTRSASSSTQGKKSAFTKTSAQAKKSGSILESNSASTLKTKSASTHGESSANTIENKASGFAKKRPLSTTKTKSTKAIEESKLVQCTSGQEGDTVSKRARRSESKKGKDPIEKTERAGDTCTDHDLQTLLKAVQSGKVDKVSAILKKNQMSKEACTEALLLAATLGHKFIAVRLISHGADLHGRDADGKTAAHLALENRYPDLALMFVKKGLDVNSRSNSGDCLLLTAVKHCSYSLVPHLLNNGADVNSQDNNGNTPLMVCVLKHDFDSMAFLIERVTDWDQVERLKNKNRKNFFSLVDMKDMQLTVKLLKTESSLEILHKAVELNCSRTVEHLLNCNFVDVNSSPYSYDRLSALSVALSPDVLFSAEGPHHTDPTIVKLLLNHGAKVNFEQGNSKQPFFLAAATSHLDVVKMIVERGADVHQVDEKGNTALMIAAQANQVENVEYLIELGADVNIKNNEDETALSKALSNKSTEAAKALIAHSVDIDGTSLKVCASMDDLVSCQMILEAIQLAKPPDDLFLFSISKDALQVTKFLIDKGANVNQIINGLNPLSQVQSEAMAELLLKHGAEVNTKSTALGHHGYTALHEAVKCGDFETVNCLVDHGADLNLLDDSQNTPLMLSIFQDRVEEAFLLIEQGADVNLANARGMTPLMVAAQRKHLTVVERLLEKGAHVNQATESSKETALMFATMNGHVPIMELLIQQGADVNMADSSSNTALFSANFPETVRVLSEAGANMEHKNNEGKTALMAYIETMYFSLVTVKTFVEHGAQVCVFSPNKSLSPLSALLESSINASDKLEYICKMLQAGAPKMLFPYKCPVPLMRFIMSDQRKLVREWVVNGGAPVEVCMQCMVDQNCCSERFRKWLSQSHNIHHVSPLAVAVMCENFDLAQYFISNWFLTWRDLTEKLERLKPIFRSNPMILDFINDKISPIHPSLKQLSFTSVSAFLKWDLDRETSVRHTGLPPSLQNELLFREEKLPMDSLLTPENKPLTVKRLSQIPFSVSFIESDSDCSMNTDDMDSLDDSFHYMDSSDYSYLSMDS